MHAMSPPSIPAPVLPQAPAPPPMFGSPTTPGSKPGRKPMQPTALSSMMFPTNPANTGQKSVLGT
jgi:hypothetical protein